MNDTRGLTIPRFGRKGLTPASLLDLETALIALGDLGLRKMN